MLFIRFVTLLLQFFIIIVYGDIRNDLKLEYSALSDIVLVLIAFFFAMKLVTVHVESSTSDVDPVDLKIFHWTRSRSSEKWISKLRWSRKRRQGVRARGFRVGFRSLVCMCTRLLRVGCSCLPPVSLPAARWLSACTMTCKDLRVGVGGPVRVDAVVCRHVAAGGPCSCTGHA